jgi:hypothetical protein
MAAPGRKTVGELEDPGQVPLIDNPGKVVFIFIFQQVDKVSVGELVILGKQQGFNTRIIFKDRRLVRPVQKMGVHFVTVITGPVVIFKTGDSAHASRF